MAERMRITLNRAGVGEILKGAPMEAEMLRRAESIARSAGEGFEATSVQGRTRARALVYATTYEAAARQRKDNVLMRAFDAGRG